MTVKKINLNVSTVRHPHCIEVQVFPGLPSMTVAATLSPPEAVKFRDEITAWMNDTGWVERDGQWTRQRGVTYQGDLDG